jgi:release factor glutamine methyltransferase
LAQKNAALNNVNNIIFLTSDLFSNIPTGTTFDIILSNPPYIALAEWSTLDPSVTDWEDTRALVAPDGGLQVLRTIINQAPAYLTVNAFFAAQHIPVLGVEIGYQQALAVKNIFTHAGFRHVTVQHDLQGHPRIIMGCHPHGI